MSEMEVLCGVYGEGSMVFSVTVPGEARVGHLKEAIVKAMNQRFHVDPSLVRLYLAKKDGAWLKEDATLKTFLQGDVDETYEEMFESWRLKDTAYFGPNFEPEDEDIHVLVELPHVPASKLRWKPSPDMTPALEKGSLYSANREDAVKQLCKIHQLTFLDATKATRGREWHIVLADNESGMGKSTFAARYIQRCIENWPSECTDKRFRESLCACHTLRVVVPPHAFTRTPSPQGMIKTIIAFVAEAIKDKLEISDATSLPQFLAHPTTIDHHSFMTTVVRTLGPVFIVLDSIGQGFLCEDSANAYAIDEDKSRELFLDFCSSVLTTWLNTAGVYFVLVGYAPYLRNVGKQQDLRPRKSSLIKFVRLNLKLIGPSEIEEMIMKTLVDRSKSQTLAQRWRLSTEAEVQEAARLMLFKTRGHPRSMVKMFLDNKTFDDFLKAEVDVFDTGRDPVAWEIVYRELCQWGPVLKQWLPSILDKTPIDLTQDWSCQGQHESNQERHRVVSYATITQRCHLGWEGTVEQATIYALPRVLTALIGIVQPLRPYIQSMHHCIDCVSLADTTAFEWMCLKRFQELFDSPRSPKKVLPEFFGEDTVFGSLDGVVSSPHTAGLPKIMTKPTTFVWPTLIAPTARPTDWHFLMSEIEMKLGHGSSSLCLKSPAQSYSPDVIFIHRVKSRDPMPGEKRTSDDVSGENSTRTLTLGIAVKNYGATMKFGPHQLQDECKKFDAMFTGLDSETKKRFGTMTNVLVVCATNYSVGFAQAFGDRRYSTRGSWDNIDEVLLLDLTTSDRRTEFFGLTREPDLARVLNELIDKAAQERDQSEDEEGLGGP